MKRILENSSLTSHSFIILSFIQQTLGTKGGVPGTGLSCGLGTHQGIRQRKCLHANPGVSGRCPGRLNSLLSRLLRFSLFFLFLKNKSIIFTLSVKKNKYYSNQHTHRCVGEDRSQAGQSPKFRTAGGLGSCPDAHPQLFRLPL